MTPMRRTPPRTAKPQRGFARATQLVRYLVQDAAGILSDLGYEIRDRVRTGKRRRRRDRTRRSAE
jgi:hypothetical protein